MLSLQMRMVFLLAALFAIIYAIITMIGTSMGVYNLNLYLGLAVVMMFIQYMIGPNIVAWSMRVKYVKREDYPELYAMVEDQARRANIPMPKVCVSPMGIPNAFAFGRSRSDCRVCVT